MRHQAKEWLVGLALVAGCYAPAAVEGVRCDPTHDDCPIGQSCITLADGHACYTNPGLAVDAVAGEAAVGDAAGDGQPSSSDLDGDGIPDEVDNCPTKPNPDQADEDGDLAGDLCDPCPPVAGGDDTDGDGVGDACDPDPNTPGDQIVLFEGFAGGIPQAWSATGAWSSSGGAAVITSQATNIASLVIPVVGTQHQTLSTDMTLTAKTQATGGSLGIVDGFDPTGALGLHCGAGRANTAVFGLINAADGTFLQTVAGPFAIGTRFQLRMQRRDASYTCATTGTPSYSVTARPNVTRGPFIGLRARIASASFKWIMLVRSP